MRICCKGVGRAGRTKWKMWLYRIDECCASGMLLSCPVAVAHHQRGIAKSSARGQERATSSFLLPSNPLLVPSTERNQQEDRWEGNLGNIIAGSQLCHYGGDNWRANGGQQVLFGTGHPFSYSAPIYTLRHPYNYNKSNIVLLPDRLKLSLIPNKDTLAFSPKWKL